MATRYSNNPKTLAKTLATILYHSPGEYGLYWDPDGTMPWKEFHWALQEDASLRFVRESHLKEIAYLGIEFPAVLDGKLCRLKENVAPPVYPAEANPPRRVYYGCPRRRLPTVREKGLHPTSRPFLPLLADREMALRMVRRRDPEGIVIEVEAQKAIQEGIAFLAAGGPLYLASGVPASCLILPLFREEMPSKAAEAKKGKTAKKATVPTTPGSFFVDAAHFEDVAAKTQGRAGTDRQHNKGRRGAEWKRESRKDRGKREV